MGRIGRAPWLWPVAILAAPALAQDTVAPADAPSVSGQVHAQGPASGAPSARPGTSAILVLNQERLLARSLYGRRIQREIEAAASALTAENREIEARLTEEELRLTELRPTMDPAEFRVLADDFDRRVEGIRTAQEAKTRDLQTRSDAAQARFFDLATPILLEMVRERGAAVLLDSRGVLLSAETVDITEAALDRLDAEIGAGGAETPPPPEAPPE